MSETAEPTSAPEVSSAPAEHVRPTVATRPFSAFSELSEAEDMNARFRATMEDSHVVQDNFAGDPTQAFFGVFDGHGGRGIVDYVAQHLGTHLQEELARRDGANMTDILTSAFTITDINSREADSHSSGCTAVTCLLRKEGDDKFLYAANVGDSRAVLSRAGAPVRITTDHKASDEAERKRIEDAGGFVLRGRVLGMLAVARSFGDHTLKPFVPAKPDVQAEKLGPDDEFVILACDGLWDVVTDLEAVNLVHQWMREGKDKQSVAEALLEEAKEHGSTDNITVLVVFF